MKINITKFNPCDDGLEYYNSQPDFETAWNNCLRGDWMLWMAKKMDVDVKILTLAKGLCANTVRHFMKDERSIAAVDAAIAFGKDQITKEELQPVYVAAYAAYIAAAAAVYDAANADATAAANAAYVAAYAAAYAANTAAVASVASDVAYAAATVAYAAATTYPVAAKEANQKQTADICREILTEEIFNKVKLL